MAAPTIFTVGHSSRTLAELVEVLREAGVTHLVDVRRFPGSRRHPQFGAARLAEGLAAAGIGYRHEAALGGRREPRPESPNTAWRDDQLRGYADHMASVEFAGGMARLQAEGARQPTAVMCAEADPRDCHRQLLADALSAAGWEVVHLLGGGRREGHRRHPALQVGAGGVLRYPRQSDAEAAGQRTLPGFGATRRAR